MAGFASGLENLASNFFQNSICPLDGGGPRFTVERQSQKYIGR